MNVFTLTAAGLVALGVPLAAPWLAQEPAPSVSTTALAPAQVLDLRDAFASTTTEPAPLAVISTSPIAPTSPQEPAAPARVRLLEPNATTPSVSTGALLAPQDEAARQIAELQARIAALQAEVAALSAHQAHAASTEALDTWKRDEEAAQALLLDKVAQERGRAYRQAEGERRRAEREAQRGLAEAERARADALRKRSFDEFEEQRAWLESSRATYEKAAVDHEAALEDLEAYMDENELSDRELDALARQRAEIQRSVESFLAQAEAHEDMYEQLEEQLEELDWDGFEYSVELEELGYIDTEECEECDESEPSVDAFKVPANAAALERKVAEEWLAQARADFGGSAATGWPGDGHGGALPRSSNGDVIVNVGGGGGHDAQIVDLLREIRDEVRALRADLRGLHGAEPAAPRAPRASRSDFGYAPNSSSGPGVATGGGFGQGADPFGWPQTTAPQAEGLPTSGNLYGGAPSAPPGGDANALSSVEIHAPRVIRQPAPMIDAALRAAGPATVHVNLLVSETGAVANAAVKSSTDARFEQAALDAVTQWVFAPGRVDGEASAMFVDVPIVFPSTGK